MNKQPTVDTCPARIELPPDPASPARARAFVRAHLSVDGDVRENTDVMENTELIVSELVTNGVLHARTSMHLGLAPDREQILIALKDENDELPIGRSAADSAENGRGILLLEVLSAEWGVVSHGRGKTVWARVRLPNSEPAVRDGGGETASW